MKRGYLKLSLAISVFSCQAAHALGDGNLVITSNLQRQVVVSLCTGVCPEGQIIIGSGTTFTEIARGTTPLTVSGLSEGIYLVRSGMVADAVDLGGGDLANVHLDFMNPISRDGVSFNSASKTYTLNSRLSYLPGAVPASGLNPLLLKDSSFPSSWDWRNRHGENWMTPVENQGSVPDCPVFGAFSSLESNANLQFNDHLDLQFFDYTVTPSAPPNPRYTMTSYSPTCGGSVFSGSLFANASCSSITTAMKKYLIATHGVSEVGVNSGTPGWPYGGHAMAVIGWETDPLDGKPIWIMKNSWGTGYFDHGYVHLKDNPGIDWLGTGSSHYVTTLLDRPNPTPLCVDKDGDGYCNWGLGKRGLNCPASCAAHPNERDFDDSNPLIGPFVHYDYDASGVNLNPVAISPQMGSIQVNPSVSGAKVFLNNGYRGITPLTLTNIPVGIQTIKITKIGFADQISSVTLGAGQTVTVNPTLISDVDVIAPNVKIVLPLSNTTVQGQITINAVASDNLGVSRVEFYKDLDSTPFATDSTLPYAIFFKTTSVSDGAHIIRARAFDAAGYSALSPPITINVVNNNDTELPKFQFMVQMDTICRAKVSGSIRVLAHAYDNVGIARTEFYVDSLSVAPFATFNYASSMASPYSAYLDTRTLSNGSHVILIKTYDLAGNTNDSIRNFSVQCPINVSNSITVPPPVPPVPPPQPPVPPVQPPVQPPVPPQPPTDGVSPSNLTATWISGARVTLKWKDNSSDEKGFQIEESTDGVKFVLIKTVGANTTVYDDQNNNAKGSTHFWRVRAFSSPTVHSGYSNVISAKIGP